jgi:hypothetical protein
MSAEADIAIRSNECCPHPLPNECKKSSNKVKIFDHHLAFVLRIFRGPHGYGEEPIQRFHGQLEAPRAAIDENGGQD